MSANPTRSIASAFAGATAIEKCQQYLDHAEVWKDFRRTFISLMLNKTVPDNMEIEHHPNSFRDRYRSSQIESGPSLTFYFYAPGGWENFYTIHADRRVDGLRSNENGGGRFWPDTEDAEPIMECSDFRLMLSVITLSKQLETLFIGYGDPNDIFNSVGRTYKKCYKILSNSEVCDSSQKTKEWFDCLQENDPWPFVMDFITAYQMT